MLPHIHISCRSSALFDCAYLNGLLNWLHRCHVLSNISCPGTSLSCTSETHPFQYYRFSFKSGIYPKLYFCIGSTPFRFLISASPIAVSPLVTPPVVVFLKYIELYCSFLLSVLYHTISKMSIGFVTILYIFFF